MNKLFKYLVIAFISLNFFACKQAPDSLLKTSNNSFQASQLIYNSSNPTYYISAHRGGKGYMGYPENCLETIAFLADKGVKTFEIDIAATKDGKLVLMHDDKLERTTTGRGLIADFKYVDLQKQVLEDEYKKATKFRVPLFKDVLNFAKNNNIVLMIDFKRSVRFQKVVDVIKAEKASDNVVLISYNQNQARKLHKLAPKMMLSVAIRNKEEYNRHHDIGLADNKMIAFVGIREPKKELYEFLHAKKIMCILGTMGNLDRKATNRGDKVYGQLLNNGADILSSDRAIESQKVITKMNH